MTLPQPPDPVLGYAPPPPRRSSRLPWLLGGVAVLAALLCLAGAGMVTVWLLAATETSQPIAGQAAPTPQLSADAGPAGTDPAAWPELTALPATTESTLRSGGNGTPTEVAFVNDSAQVVTVSWLDLDGKRVTYQTLRPGATYTQPTYVGHPWVVAAADGRALAVFQPAAERSRAVIR